MPERALKALRFMLGLGLLAGGQLLPQLLECLVEMGPRLPRQQCVEERHLDPAVSQPAVVLLGQRGKGGQFGGKRFGQDTDRAIGECHRP